MFIQQLCGLSSSRPLVLPPVDAVDRLTDTEIMAAAAKHGSLPPPASASAVADAEQKIGHRLPVLLRCLYTEAKAALPQGSGR